MPNAPSARSPLSSHVSPSSAALGAAMLDALAASGPVPHLRRELMQFGRLVGSWDLDVTYFAEDGSVRRRVPGEWHFGWVLEGRAVADVWMVPPRAERTAAEPPPGEYGMSLRFFDSRIGAWRSTWHGPVHGIVWPFIAREIGDEMVLERTDEAGALVRWIFSDVRDDAFHWRAVKSTDGARTWRLEQTMVATRRPAPDGA
ncbi:MAG TPA: hypothetical protein VFS05_03565 [Gemmatimonadaceae bacterium]|nr:hypothetical protein [Gemmatimonadaceae bacterium]